MRKFVRILVLGPPIVIVAIAAAISIGLAFGLAFIEEQFR